jgi:hypothetical protein
MKRIISVVTLALVMAAMMAMSALPALANHGSGPAPFVGPHQHYLVTESGKEVRVGPNICAKLERRENQHGFNNFHHNVHVNPDHPATVRATGCPPPA